MSFSTISSLSYTGPNGNSWALDFEIFNSAAANNTFRVLTARKTVGSEREHPLNPVLAGKLATSVYDESRTLHDRILANDNLDVRLTAKKNGTIWHRGLLDRVQNGDQVNRENPRLDLTWGDGLARLKSLSWEEGGRETLLRTLNFLLTESTRTEIPTRVAIAWEDYDAFVGDGRSQALLHDLTRQIGSGTHWDVLMQILRYYNLQCFQEDGKWYVLHRSYRDSGQSYEWEEMDADQTVSTGTTDPTASLSDADWYEKDNDEVRRPTLTPDGWRSSISLGNLEWFNDDFTSGSTDVDGNDIPEGWWLAGSGKYLSSANQVEVIPTIDGVGKSGEPGFAERVLDKRLVNVEDAGLDRVSFKLSGELDSKNDVGDAKVILGEIRLRTEGGRERWIEVDVTEAGFVTTNVTTNRSYIKRTINLSSTTDISFSIPEFTVSAPGVVSGDDVWWLRFRCVSEADPEGNGTDDITSVRWDNVELTEFREASDREVASGVSHDMAVQDELQTEEFSTSSDLEGHPGGIYYSSSQTYRRWEHLHSGSAGLTHAGRAYITEHAEEVRLRDRWSMMSQRLFRILGTQDVGTSSLRSTITYKSKDWVPHYRVEWINREKTKVGFTELRNDEDLNATIDRYTGIDRGRNVDQTTGVGGSGTTSATTHSTGANVSSASIAQGQGGGASGWDDLTDKPFTTVDDGSGGTLTITSGELAVAPDDIASALSHSPGLSDGIQTLIREEGTASDAALPTEQAVRNGLDRVDDDTTLIAKELVQTQAEIDGLDAVTVRRSRSITAKGKENRVEVDASQTIDGALTKDLVLAFDAPQDLHTGADFEVATLAAGSPNTPTNGQIALGAQADETYEAVRADRKVMITGTTNQVGVNGRSGMLTQDVSVTLSAPQDLHTAADFEVGTLAAGAPSNTPGDISAAGTIFSETEVRIKSPSKTPALLNVAGGGFFEDEINADEGIVADSYNVSTLGGSGYVLRRLQDDSTQLYSDEIVANTFRVAEFLVNQITFSASEAISAGFVARAPITHNGGGEYEVGADTNPTVAADDLVRAKRFTDGSHDSKARVVSVNRNGSDSTVTLQLVDDNNNDVSPSASNDAPEDGFQYARIGNLSDPKRQNLIYLTASDASNPRIDFFEGVSEFSEFGASALTTRVGNLSGLSSAYSDKMGVFSEVGRFTSDVIIGDLEAGTNSSVSGQYLKYDGTDIEIITESGDVETLITTNASDISQNESDIADNEADLLLLARRITQESESRAGLEFNVGENSASIEANATVIGDDSLFSQSTLSLHASETETRFESSVQYTDNNNDVDSRASISLLAGPGGSEAILAGENIILDGDTLVQGGFTVEDTNIETGYRITLRQPTEPGDGDVAGRNLKDGDIWIDTDGGDTVHTYDEQSETFQRTHSESVVIRQDSEPSSRPSGNDLQAGDIWIDTDGGDTVYTYDGSDFSSVDNGNITIRQSTEPSTRPGGATLVKGDIWIDTDADDTVYTYDGSGWVETTSQNVVIRQASEPSSRPSGNDLEKGDVWIDTDEGDTVYTYDGSSFTPADNGNVTIRQASPPSQRSSGAPLIKGDVWIDTDADDTVHTYDGSSFQRVQSDNVVIRSDSTPTERPSGNNLEEGDVWIETDEGNAVHTYNGASFERTRGEGNVTIRQASAPSQRPSGEALEEGDTWIDTDDGNTAYTYDGSQWVKTEADLRTQADQNSADVKLLARRLTQSTEAQAGIELNVGENSADIEANATVIGDDGLFSQSTLSLHASETETRFESSVQYTDNNNDVGSRASISLLAGPGGSDAILAGENILLDGDTEVQGTFSVDDGTAGGWTVNQTDIRSKPGSNDAGLLLSTDLGLARFQDTAATVRATGDVTDPTAGPFVELFAQDSGNFGLYAEDGSGNAILGLGSSPGGSTRSGDFFIDGDLLIDGSVTADEVNIQDLFTVDVNVRNQLTIDGTGSIVMNTPNGVKSFTLDQSTSFSSFPSQQQSDSNSTTITQQAEAYHELTTGTQHKSHEAKIKITNPGSSTQEFSVRVREVGGGVIESKTIRLSSSETQTAYVAFNAGQFANVECGVANASDPTKDVTLESTTLFYWDSFLDINARGIRAAMADDSYFEISDKRVRIGGGIVLDREGRLYGKGGDLYWESFDSGTKTKLN
jgi:hypothetical protein